MCIGMSDNIVSTINFKFKLITFVLFLICLLFVSNTKSVMVLFFITSFVLFRIRFYKTKKMVPISFGIVFVLYIIFMYLFKIDIINLVKFYFIILYINLLDYYSSDTEILSVLKKIFRDEFVDFIYKIKLLFKNINKYFQINNNLYGKKKVINSVYLSLKSISKEYEKINNLSSDRMYKTIKRKVIIYDYLFVFMYIVMFVFCVLSEVYL